MNDIDERSVLFITAIMICFGIALVSYIAIPSVQAVQPDYNISVNVTSTSIIYTFEPALDKNFKVWFSHELLEVPIKNILFFYDLKPDTGYTLLIEDGTSDFYQYLQVTTLPEETPEFYASYGIIGLFLLIVIMLYISTKIPYIGYATIALSAVGFMYVVKNTNDFITALIFIVLMFVSFMVIKED